MGREVYEGGKEVVATRGAHGEWRSHPGGLTGRRKLSHVFIEDLIADWVEHGRDALARVRQRRPDRYLQVVVAMVPRRLDVDVNPDVRRVEDLTDEELTIELQAALRELAKQGFKFPE